MILKEQIQSIPFVYLNAQYQSISAEIDAAIAKVVSRSAFILGQEVSLFEQAFADFCGAKYAVGVDSGTSALELALRAYGIGPGDEVITAANTFIATALAASYIGARPVLVDCDARTYTIDVDRLTEAITSRTRPSSVHLYGHPADTDPILRSPARRAIVIEDACQAHGARYKGRRAGSLGHAAAFSFYPAKNLGAFGDGGMVVTDDQQVYETVRMLRDVGQREKYHHEIKGYNHRLDTLQAAVLNVKLQYLDAWNSARRRRPAASSPTA
jgi:dTDP-4-amino-4,6-dideoxygalactose transaminase